MRLGDIFPRTDVMLVLGDQTFVVLAPTMRTLARIEQWFESTTGQKKRWNEIFGSQTEMTTKNFCEFVQLILEPGNKNIPTVDALMDLISTANFADVIKSIALAVNGTNTVGESKKSETGDPTDWSAVIRSLLQTGLSYEEIQNMTIKEISAIFSNKETEKNETVTSPTKIHPNYDPDWLKKSIQRDKESGKQTGYAAVVNRVASGIGRAS